MIIPSLIPVMTLKEVVFFPDVMLPLRIFEERYQKMLQDVLKSERMFAIVAECENDSLKQELDEPLFEVGTVGLVRVSKQSPDGTSFVMLQGISRIRIKSIVQESPYRVLKVSSFDTIETDTKLNIRQKIQDALLQNSKLGGEVTQEVLDYLGQIEDDVAFIDLASFTLCQSTVRKQAMLEVQRLSKRAEMLFDDIMQQNLTLSLRRHVADCNQDSDSDRN
jgi:Lon protease-like protein